MNIENSKKTIIIFGCGQAGEMIKKWISSDYEILGFCDNDKEKWDREFSGEMVFSPAVAIKKNPEIIFIAVMNKEAATSIELQLKDKGYEGELLQIKKKSEVIDLRLASLRLIAEEIVDRKIEGEVAELGVYQGKFAAEINRNFPEKNIYLFDTFEGFREEDIAIEREIAGNSRFFSDFTDTSVEAVINRLPNPEKALICKGYFPESTNNIDFTTKRFCFVNLDADLYEPIYQGLKFFYPRMSRGGVMMIHDYNSRQFPGVKKAVKRFCNEEKVYLTPLCDLHGTAIIIKN